MANRMYLVRKSPAGYPEYHRRWTRDRSFVRQRISLSGRLAFGKVAHTCLMATIVLVEISNAL